MKLLKQLADPAALGDGVGDRTVLGLGAGPGEPNTWKAYQLYRESYNQLYIS
jgi:hypothetical protein